MKNIILCGFMGSGKSSVGAILAKSLNREFIDLDDYIEACEKMKIPDIFKSFGEDGFREREHSAVIKLAETDGLVIASGGGALTRPENVEAIKKNGEIVFLNASFYDCYSRIKDSDRPLVKKYSREQLERLYSERAEVYRRASGIEVKADSTAAEIANTLKLRIQHI